MAIQVLIINRQLAFAVALKQALERTGAFDVHPFTTADAAVEYLNGRPQEVALVDFASVLPNGEAVVTALRRVQPGLQVIASPIQAEEVSRRLGLHASIDPPFSARDIIPLLEAAARSGAQMAELRNAPTRPMTPPPPAPTLRPGEIGEEQLRPYMYSTDLFKQRTTQDLPPEPPPAGELTTDDLRPTTDVLRPDPGATTRLRPGEDVFDDEGRPRRYAPTILPTEDLAMPSTDALRDTGSDARTSGLPPLERPDRRRTGVFDAVPAPPPPPSEQPLPSARRPGEFTEEELLNLAVTRGFLPADSGAPPVPQVTTQFQEMDDPYRISTDVFKDQPSESEPLSLSQEDAAAMWAELTRDEVVPQQVSRERVDSAPASTFAQDDENAFDFEDPGETPRDAQPAVLPRTELFVSSAQSVTWEDDAFPPVSDVPSKQATMTDLLVSAAQNATLPPDDTGMLRSAEPSGTAILVSAADAVDMPLVTEPLPGARPQAQNDFSWDFPDEQLPVSLTEPPPFKEDSQPIDPIARVRQSDEVAQVEVESLEEQLEVEALSGITDEMKPVSLSGSDLFASDAESYEPALDYTPGFYAPQQTNYPISDDIAYDQYEDVFQPPIAPETLITGVLNATPDYDPDAQQEMPRIDVEREGDDGVRRLEALADEIRRQSPGTTHNLRTPEAPPADPVFERLAAEEPPMPDPMNDSGTVGDLYNVVSDPEFRGVLRMLRSDEEDEARKTKVVEPLHVEQPPAISRSEIEDIFASYGRPTPAFTETDFVDHDEDDDESSAAQVILETALTDEPSLEPFSLPNLIANIERQLENSRGAIKPLPSWLQTPSPRDDVYVREPSFLADVIADVDRLPMLDEAEEDPFGSATTYAGGIKADISDMETEWLEPSRAPAQPQRPLAEPPVTEDDTARRTSTLEMPSIPRLEDDVPEFNTEFERLAAFSFPELEDEESQFTPPLGVEAIQDPYIAQIALSLTQVSLEDVAAIVLTRGNDIMATAGRMTRDEINEIERGLEGAWDTHSDQSSIRFVTLPSSARDYMVYSKRTIQDLTLALVFTAATPIKAIRAQAKRMLDALLAVPEPAPTSAASTATLPAAALDVRSAYTFVWLLNDPGQQLSEIVGRAIESGLRGQLATRGWDLYEVRAREDYVLLFAEVPGENPPSEIVQDLKRRAFEIARRQNPTLARTDLWADGYLVVAPGRELQADEVQQYIEFERMAP